MRNYCRVYHTSMDYLTGMSAVNVIGELLDATEELAEERKRQEKEREKALARAKSRRGRRR